MTELEKVFNRTHTANGDEAYKSTQDNLIDILFFAPFLEKNLEKVHIGTSEREKLFSMFMRDPRNGLGRRDLGRYLMHLSKCSVDDVVKAGRWDDVYLVFDPVTAAEAYRRAILSGDDLAKKWAPRYSSKDLLMARNFASLWGMTKQEYGHFIKCDTVENKMSRKRFDRIDFSKLPSLALLKYWQRFSTGDDTRERFAQWQNDVRVGSAKINSSVTNVYDIYRNRKRIDADLVYESIAKCEGSWLPIIDVSGSMYSDDNMGKALSIGKWLSDTSTYCKGQFVTFSEHPKLVTQSGVNYNDIIDKMSKSNWGMNTDLGAVMDMLSGLKSDFPDWLVILSDMQFDAGSCMKKDEMMKAFRDLGADTKIVWWNFDSDSQTSPETDEYGNIFMSGYNPVLLQYLSVGFDSHKFLDVLLSEYEKKMR